MTVEHDYRRGFTEGWQRALDEIEKPLREALALGGDRFATQDMLEAIASLRPRN